MNRNHQSKNIGERSYQGWISHTDENLMDNSNYRSDGPGPVEIEAHDTKSDDGIKEEICEILIKDRHIDASSIFVGVENGIVKLTGSVRSRQEKIAIEDAIENVSGINEVQNDIKVQKNSDAIEK